MGLLARNRGFILLFNNVLNLLNKQSCVLPFFFPLIMSTIVITAASKMGDSNIEAHGIFRLRKQGGKPSNLKPAISSVVDLEAKLQ